MGKRGPRPLPTALKLLRGNPGKRRVNRREPKPDIKAPACPPWLNKVAKGEWARVVPKLEALGLISELDMAVLAGYCASYARFKQAEEIIDREGLTYEMQTKTSVIIMKRPEVSIMEAERRILRQFAAEFGFSPSSRSGMKMLPDPDEDDLSRFMRGTGA